MGSLVGNGVGSAVAPRVGDGLTGASVVGAREIVGWGVGSPGIMKGGDVGSGVGSPGSAS